ncbi:copper chaperone PCu(A)C [Puniceibacterium confluentis]|uniref:copper chaperone PCu(A)C n=1 Tax=Puniceibacterium confluentis TaxID=1958944 RepID=UPI0011B82AFF|nr:copper chaperone PCu(A)C [Puniceibacterium confluentis]
MKLLFAAALLCSLPALTLAQEYTLGPIAVDHPHAFEAPPVARTLAGYMSITNHGTHPDTLIAVEADFPRVTVHQSQDSDGVARMSPVERLDLAPGQTVTFAPGGHHVMFMGLDGKQLDTGSEIAAVLVFENAGRLDVVFSIEARPTADGGHASH